MDLLTTMLAVGSSETSPERVIDHFLSPASVMATITLLSTGSNAALAVAIRQPPEQLAHAINIGIARGFIASFFPTLVTFIAALDSVA